MIVLTYAVDEQAWREDRELAPSRAEPAALEHTYFVMRVRFSIHDRELLAHPGLGPWYPLPLLGLASAFARVARLAPGERYVWKLPGGDDHLAFAIHESRTGSRAAVTSSMCAEALLADAVALRGTARGFVERIRGDVAERIPAMRRHPAWATSFGA